MLVVVVVSARLVLASIRYRPCLGKVQEMLGKVVELFVHVILLLVRVLRTSVPGPEVKSVIVFAVPLDVIVNDPEAALW
jgi:hypothetical protein